MLVINSNRQEFENWMNNAAIKEPEKTNFFNWIIDSPIDIYIPRIPPVGCLISGLVDSYRIKINLFAISPNSAISVFKQKYPNAEDIYVIQDLFKK